MRNLKTPRGSNHTERPETVMEGFTGVANAGVNAIQCAVRGAQIMALAGLSALAKKAGSNSNTPTDPK